MADNPAPARRRRRRGSKSTEGSEPDARAALAASSKDAAGTPPRSSVGVLSNASDPAAGLGADAHDEMPEPAQARAELATSEEEEEDKGVPEDQGITSSLLPPKRLAAMRKTKRDNTQPLAATAQHVHVIGQIDKGVGFPPGAFVSWTLVTGDRWELVAGQDGGRTFQDATPEGDEASWSRKSIWDHPIDIHYAATERDLKGQWPRLLVHVNTCDYWRREEVVGYGVVSVPMVPGTHELEIPTWKPCGGNGDVIETLFIGQPIQIMDDQTIVSGERRRELSRYQILNESAGTVFVTISILLGKPA